MTSQPPSPTSPPLKRGTYHPHQPTDLRSPCPGINTLANHGYIARDGRSVRSSEIHAALGELGLGSFLATCFAWPPFLELHTGPSPPKKESWWSIIRSPFAYMLRGFALREPGQVDSEGVPCVNLDQLGRHNVVEHDVSMTRFDYAQGDNHTPQPELIANLLAKSGNGSTLTLADFVKLRKERYARQAKENPKLEYGKLQNYIACTEVALILKVFGNGEEVPLSYVKAFVGEERLPWEEGWKRRVWWTLGLMELNSLAKKVISLVGGYRAEEVPTVAVVH